MLNLCNLYDLVLTIQEPLLPYFDVQVMESFKIPFLLTCWPKIYKANTSSSSGRLVECFINLWQLVWEKKLH